MRKIQYDSPYQAEVEASEHGIVFRRGVPVDVEDDVAERLLKNAHFSEAAPKSAVAKAEQRSFPAPMVIPEAASTT